MQQGRNDHASMNLDYSKHIMESLPEMTAAWNDHVCSLPISQISGLRNSSVHEQNAKFVNTLHAAECLDRCIFSVPIAAEALIADAHGRQCEDVCRQYYSKHIME